MGLAGDATRLYMRFHKAVYVRTDGRIGARLVGVPTLLLRTTGRRSGETRIAALTYAGDGGGYVVAASNDGREQPPAWLLNLQADPHVDVQMGRHRSGATARIVDGGDLDYARLWKLVNDNNHGRYDGYQSKTNRPIALVVLDPT
jgi:deazaflavin-dependent oxidoreductase (nitroreductase family)